MRGIGATGSLGGQRGASRGGSVGVWTASNEGRGPLYRLYIIASVADSTPAAVPRHVAMMIDGNRRWARQLGYESAAHGHRAGAAKMREFLEWCDDVGICVGLALPALDRQPRQADRAGARRPHRDHRRARRGALARPRLAGAARRPPDTAAARASRRVLARAEHRTATNTGLHVNLAVGYGGRRRDRRRVRSIIAAARRRGRIARGARREPHARADRRAPLHRRAARPRPRDPHVGRAAAERLPALAERALRVLLRRGARPRPARGRLPARDPRLRDTAIVDSAADDGVPSAKMIDGRRHHDVTDLDDFISGFDRGTRVPRLGRVRAALVRACATRRSRSTPSCWRGRYGSIDLVAEHDARGREAASRRDRLSDAEQIVLQPSTTYGLMHAMYGLAGGVLLSADEFPSLTIAAVARADALGSIVQWLEPEHGCVTPGLVRERSPTTRGAVAVSLVDFRTRLPCDLEGSARSSATACSSSTRSRASASSMPWEAADVVCSGGHKWVRAGRGTGLMVLSTRALERIAPVLSGFAGTEDDEPWGHVPPPAPVAQAYRGVEPRSARRGTVRDEPARDPGRRRPRDRRRRRRAREPRDLPRRRVRRRRRDVARRAGARRHRHARAAGRAGRRCSRRRCPTTGSR